MQRTGSISPARRTPARLLALSIVAIVALGVVNLPLVAAQPGMTVVSPTEGATVTGPDVTVEVELSGFALVPSTVPLTEAGMHPEANQPGEGHLHLMLDLGAVVVWDSSEPYTFTNVPTGDHLLTVELLNNDHSSLSPSVVQEIRFQTVEGAVLPNTGGGDGSGWSASTSLLLAGIATALFLGGLVVRRRSDSIH
jgi:hypothetical protein